MALSIDLRPELEAELREQAAREGMAPDAFIRKILEEQMRQARGLTAPPPLHLPHEETVLLQKINQGLPGELWQQYHQLVAKRRAETLTPEEQADLIALSDQIEEANARRIGHLVELAQLRQTSLEALMDQLGIKSPGYA